MRTCSHCGNVVTDAALRDCPNCGLSLATDQYAPQQIEPTPVYAAPPAFNAPPTQPLTQPPYGQPPYGQPPYGQPPYGPAYGAPTNWPSAYPPGAYPPGDNWPPNSKPARRPWGRITAAVVGALVIIALVVSVYNQMRVKLITPVSANATATAQNIADHTLLADSLASNVNSWDADKTHCYFAQDGYHIHNNYVCYAPIGVQTDGTESVDASEISGPTNYGYGLAFRLTSTGGGYKFVIDVQGDWAVVKITNGHLSYLQKWAISDAIKGGFNTENKLSVTMKGSTFDFAINGVKVGEVHDSSYDAGKWGLLADSTDNVVFTNYLAQSA